MRTILADTENQIDALSAIDSFPSLPVFPPRQSPARTRCPAPCGAPKSFSLRGSCMCPLCAPRPTRWWTE